MVGFFISTGGEEAGSEFVPFIWGENSLDPYFKRELNGREYGKDVKLFLIMFYVEGHLPMWLPKRIRPSYSKEEKALSVEVPVLRAEFHPKDDSKRRRFIVQSVLKSLDSARGLCQRKKLDLDLDALIVDVRKAVEAWLTGGGIA